MNTPAEILAGLTVIKSGKHSHFASQGYFLCPTHENDRKMTLPAGTAVTCSKCLKRLAQLQAQTAGG